MPKRIAIIGAGASGITSAKQCLEQGLDVVVFEKTNYTAGLWRYQPEVAKNGIASVMKSTVINTSKEMSSFSDFPPPKEYPNFMHHTKMASYLDMYASSFNFRNYVRFGHEIVSVEMTDDHSSTGQWKVLYRVNATSDADITDINVQVETFDGVMICSGHHSTPNIPYLKGQEIYRGAIMHTHELKSSAGFEDKSIAVIGIGNSGADAAVELAPVATQVYLSTRRGAWVHQRLGPDGRPFDQYYLRRALKFILNLMPFWLACTLLEWYFNFFLNHETYQLKPKHRCLEQHGLINDGLPSKILSGTIQVKGNLDYFTENGVVFRGETETTPLDVIVLATGYKIHYPVLSSSILPVEHNQVHLYKYQFIPNLPHPQTLTLIGLAQVQGSLIPVVEMQARWFALLNSDKSKIKLPSQKVMEKEMWRHEKQLRNQFYESDRHTIEADYILLMDDISRQIGAHPPIWKYFFTDPRLYFALMFGACATYQYRLIGPNRWKGARETMLTIQDRITAGLQTNHNRKPSKSFLTNYSCVPVMFVCSGLALFCTFWGTVAFVITLQTLGWI